MHLFNAADLPIAGFLRFVVIPEYLPHLPEIALALVDLATSVLKPLAPTARAEMAGDRTEATPRAFANALAHRVEVATVPGSRIATDEASEADLRRSYGALRSFLEQPARAGKARAAGSSAGRIDRGALADIAVRGRSAATAAATRAASTAASRSAADLAPLWDTIRWCYEMILPRCRHLRDYLRTIRAPGRRTDLLINLLVDYDAWLGDTPAEGSSTTDQLAFWSGYARAVRSAAEIRTFAGYDPLRHAEDRLSLGGRSPYWAVLRETAERGLDQMKRPGPASAGFKLYPPMGFKVFGNAGDEPGPDRSGELVRRRWEQKGWPVPRFGFELDAVLDEFFAFCSTRRIPVVAHGRHSQEASSGTGAFASPRFWFERARAVHDAGGPPLRACVAHWTASDDFRVWMPRILELNRAGAAEIYFDLAYTPEFLTGAGTPLLDALAQLARTADPEGRFVLFGSDWIMLGREPGVEGYVQGALAAIDAVPFWRERRELLLNDNLRRFLRS